MTRLNELSTELNRLAPGALARTTDTQTLINRGRRTFSNAGFGRAKAMFANSDLARSWRRRRTIADLHKLSDRMLADIGLTRGQIVEVATLLSAAPATGKVRTAKPAQPSVYGRMRQAQVRRKTIRELEQLPDRILADIGIARGQIPAAVDEILEKRSGPAAAGVAGDSPVHELLSHLEGAVRPLRQWHLSRLAAGQIARLGSATLSDLGYVKGDVDWVPEVLANRKIANSHNPDQRSHAGAA